MGNRMSYQMAATAVTLNDLEGHSPVADLFIAQSFEHLCSILHDFNWQCARAVPLHSCINARWWRQLSRLFWHRATFAKSWL